MRGDGKTTKQLTDLLELAQGPQLIIYMGINEQNMRYNYQLMLHILDKRNFLKDLSVDRFDFKPHYIFHKIELINTGAEIRFESIQRSTHFLRGMRNYSIILDHAIENIPPEWLEFLAHQAKIVERQ